MEGITKHQLFSILLLFMIGSTTIFALGINAGRDAWLAMLMAAAAGLALIWIYTELQKDFPERNLVEIIFELLGRPLGIPLAFLYALGFLYTSTFNHREFGELVAMSFLHSTPVAVLLTVFIFTVFYVLFLGFKVFARTGEIAMPVVIVFLVSIYLFIIFSGRVKFSELQPILGNGIVPVVSAAFPDLLGFPYGETVVFLMYWCYVTPQNEIRRPTFVAVLIATVLIIASLIVMITTLGAGYTANTTIPLLEVIKLINIGDILTNLESIGVIIMFIGGFYKMTLFFFGGVLVISTLLGTKNLKPLIVVLGLCVLFFSIGYEKSYAFHIWAGLGTVPRFIYPATEIAIPVMLLILSKLKKAVRNAEKRAVKDGV